MITAERYHGISCGHRVVGQGGKCENLHGHNYRIHFTVGTKHDAPDLDDVGRVLDFSVIKYSLCEYLEDYWDHKFLCWEDDRVMKAIHACLPLQDDRDVVCASLVWVPFNPTAENMAKYLVEEVAPVRLRGTGCELISCRIEETRKCSATFSLW